MDERIRFVSRLKDGESMAALCREFQISRKTGYKIFDRYEECGSEGLTDRAGAPTAMPINCPSKSRRPAGANLLQQQAKFDAFIEEFNNERPHQALEMKCPAEVYTPSCRPHQSISESHYPLHDKTVVVANCGRLWLYRKKINLSICLAGQAVGIKEVDDGIWLVSFMDYDLGCIDLEEKTLQPLNNPFGPKVLPMS